MMIEELKIMKTMYTSTGYKWESVYKSDAHENLREFTPKEYNIPLTQGHNSKLRQYIYNYTMYALGKNKKNQDFNIYIIHICLNVAAELLCI
jgi:hypothetical protein